jgi:serine/threonine protein kinase
MFVIQLLLDWLLMNSDHKDRDPALARERPFEELGPVVFTGAGVAKDELFAIAPELKVGDVIDDKYKIIKLLGIGASGSVFEAEHTEIGRRVAIKVVHRSLATRSDIVARFRIEARICGKIRNPHVGQVHDVGQLSDGLPFMVMELHEGESLATALSKGPLPIPTAIDVGKQILTALQAAQEFGVVHRDVKPGNVMIARDSGGQLVIKLVDFGISKPLADDIASHSGRISLRNVTLEGAIVGSPDYMPPEQLRGRDIDIRTDLYAAGVVLYEMVTGRTPFNAPSLTELAAAILRDPVAPPSQLRAECPVELDRVILKAISRSKSSRYQTALEMSLALDEVIAHFQYPVGSAVWALTPSFAPSAPAARPSDTVSNEGSKFSVSTFNVWYRRVFAIHPRYVFAMGALGVAGIALAVTLGNAARTRVPIKITSLSEARLKAARSPAIDLEIAAHQSRAQPQGGEVKDDVANPSTQALPRGSSGNYIAKPASSRTESQKTLSKRSGANNHAIAIVASPSGATSRAASPATVLPSRVSAAKISVSELIAQASAAYVRGQLPVARSLYAKAVEIAPRNAAAWRGLGMASSRMAQRQDAIRAFERYLKLAPSAPDASGIRQKLEELRR